MRSPHPSLSPARLPLPKVAPCRSRSGPTSSAPGARSAAPVSSGPSPTSTTPTRSRSAGAASSWTRPRRASARSRNATTSPPSTARTPDEAQAMLDQMTATAAEVGLEFRFDRARAGNTFDAHRLIHLALERGGATLQDAVKDRLLTGYLRDGEPIGDPAALTRLAVEAGLAEADVAEVLAGRAVRRRGPGRRGRGPRARHLGCAVLRHRPALRRLGRAAARGPARCAPAGLAGAVTARDGRRGSRAPPRRPTAATTTTPTATRAPTAAARSEPSRSGRPAQPVLARRRLAGARRDARSCGQAVHSLRDEVCISCELP